MMRVTGISRNGCVVVSGYLRGENVGEENCGNVEEGSGY